MAFDECTGYPASHAEVVSSTNRSLRWAKRCIAAKKMSGLNYLGSFRVVLIQSFDNSQSMKLPNYHFLVLHLAVFPSRTKHLEEDSE